MESVIGSSNLGNDFDKMDWRDVMSDDLKQPPQVKSSNQVVTGIINELFEVKKGFKE